MLLVLGFRASDDAQEYLNSKERREQGLVEDDELRSWFCREVLSLEAPLTRYIRRNHPRAEDVVDIRQEVYSSALQGAQSGFPDNTSAYIFAIARNNLISRSRREQIVSFEFVADLDAARSDFAIDDFDRHLIARDELRRAFEGIRQLPARCAQVVHLRKVEGFSTRETAERMGISTHTVERQLTLGMRALVDFMLGGSGKLKRGAKNSKSGRRHSK